MKSLTIRMTNKNISTKDTSVMILLNNWPTQRTYIYINRKSVHWLLHFFSLASTSFLYWLLLYYITAVDKFEYQPRYGTEFGGVTGISPSQYRRANGHSNQFWGWGGEDNDMEFRIFFKYGCFLQNSWKCLRFCTSWSSSLWSWGFQEKYYQK